MSSTASTQCPYDVLELKRFVCESKDDQDSTLVTQTIKEQYLKLVRVLHPDRNPTIGQAPFQLLSAAFNAIRTPNDRQNFKNCNPPVELTKKAPASNQQVTVFRGGAMMSFEAAMNLYVNAELSNDQFVAAYASFIGSQGGSIYMATGHKAFLDLDPLYKQKFISMGNVKIFCSDHEGFAYNEGTDKRGSKVTYTAPAQSLKGSTAVPDAVVATVVPAGAGGSRSFPCAFFGSPKGCTNGDSCRFYHGGAPPTTETNRKPSASSSVIPTSPAPQPPMESLTIDSGGLGRAPVPPVPVLSWVTRTGPTASCFRTTPCNNFTGPGSCSHGDNCKFYHHGVHPIPTRRPAASATPAVPATHASSPVLATAGSADVGKMGGSFRITACHPFSKFGRCSKGDKCTFYHEGVHPPEDRRRPVAPRTKAAVSATPARPRHLAIWDNKVGHKKVIIVGGSGHGKSTFINSAHNFFCGNTVDSISAVIPTVHIKYVGAYAHSERGGSATQSQTIACNEYRFTNPSDSSVSITFVDTPGLADTRGAAQDNLNMQKILEVAAECERDGSLSGIIFCIRGSEKRASLSIETITTILNCSLPDAVFEDIIVAFTMSMDKAEAIVAEELIPFQVKEENKFYFDNPRFELDSLLGLNARFEYHVRDMWSQTMEQIGNIVDTVFSHMGTVSKGSVAEMLAQRMKLQAVFHDVKLTIANLQGAQQRMEDADTALRCASAAKAGSQNFKVEKKVMQKVSEPCNHHNTLCSTCDSVCHTHCGLQEITEQGLNAFQGCCAFMGSTNCRVCPKRCSYATHYHGRKMIVEKEVTEETVR